MTSTQIPGDYDASLAAGWTYHRNGVSGCPFYAEVEDGALRIAWAVADDNDLEAEPTYPVAATIPLPILDGLARLDAVGETFNIEIRRTPSVVRHVVELADGTPRMHVFDLAHDYEPQLRRILVVSDLIDGEDPRVAAFELGELVNGDASTTLRGDCLHEVAVAVAAAMHPSAWPTMEG